MSPYGKMAAPYTARPTPLDPIVGDRWMKEIEEVVE